MEHRGWKMMVYLVCAVITLLVVACVSSSHPPLLATELPPITLTLWLAATSTHLPALIPVTVTPSPAQTVTPIIYQVPDDATEPDELQVTGTRLHPLADHPLIITRLLPTQTPPPLQPAPPTCYETASDALECLGFIRNDRSQPIERVSASIKLYDASGTLVAEQTAHVEQRFIPPGDAAPYRALFLGETVKASRFMLVSLRSADLAAPSPLLLIQNESINQQDNLFTVTAQVKNPGSLPYANVRAVLTLYDAEDRVAGYRVMDLGTLLPDSALPVHIQVQASSTAVLPLTPVLYAEVWSGH